MHLAFAKPPRKMAHVHPRREGVNSKLELSFHISLIIHNEDSNNKKVIFHQQWIDKL